MPNVSRRPLKVGSVIQKALVEILHKLGLQHTTISEVQLSPDLRYATVFFFPLNFKTKTTERDFVMLAPIIRIKLSKLVKLKYLPELRFKLDKTFDSFSRINALINKKNT